MTAPPRSIEFFCACVNVGHFLFQVECKRKPLDRPCLYPRPIDTNNALPFAAFIIAGRYIDTGKPCIQIDQTRDSLIKPMITEWSHQQIKTFMVYINWLNQMPHNSNFIFVRVYLTCMFVCVCVSVCVCVCVCVGIVCVFVCVWPHSTTN